MIVLSKQDALAAADVAGDKKARDIVLLEISGLVSYADYFLVCSGRSVIQVKAIVNAVKEYFGKRGIHPLHVEGFSEGRWVLLDYDEIIIHIFLEEARSFYNLERLWGDVPQTVIETELPPGKAAVPASA